jgi:hypothetical protein
MKTKPIFFLLALGFLFSTCSPAPQEMRKGDKKLQSIKDAFEWEFERTKDPALGYPPTERLLLALEKTRQKQDLMAGHNNRGDISSPKWRERGPNNIGGRTRVIHIDLNDPTRKTVWAGGVAGGLWKTTDIDAADPQWQKINDYKENMAIAGMAQDPNNPQIMYLGTGEGYPNWDAVAGLGLFKSTNGGDSWQLLPSTLNVNFRYTREMIVTPQSHVYVATNRGLYRSADGGASWQKVLGNGFGTNDEMFDLVYASDGNLYASNTTNIFKSATGNPNEWTEITKSPVPNDLSRLEFSVCQADPNVIYCIGSDGGGASPVYYTTNGGQTWAIGARPENGNGSEFTNGQAWYDLEIAVDPSSCYHVIAGGVPIRRSVDGALSWIGFGQGIHVDQHITVFDEQDPNKIYFGNDGGIYRIILNDDGSVFRNEDKNLGYNVTQYYACAMHPDSFSNIFLGGTQDNGSHLLNGAEIAPARNVWGGDGFMCHVDQNEPHLMMVSSQYANWGYSLNGGLDFNGGLGGNGGFYTPSDYDSEKNILYSQTNDGDFYRWQINDYFWELVDVNNFTINDISNIRVDDNVPGRIYICTSNPSQIIRVDNAHSGTSLEGVQVGSFNGYIASLDIENGNPDHLLITLSNYGLPNNIFESKDGGLTWQGVEGSAVPDNLPDMPVRWGIFNPNDATQAMIATEAGVWTTELLNGNQTVWIPPMPGIGIPLVRTDMLEVRQSDKLVLASTHARGMFTTDVFSNPAPYMDYSRVHYRNSEMRFLGSGSLGADSYAWNLGDGTISSQENVSHAYSETGEYPVSLTINGDLTKEGSVKILPDLPTPYEQGKPAYGGGFESNTEQYGVHTFKGSSFQRGQSAALFKDGTHSGDNAFVVELNGSMKPNTHTILYLPNFDLSAPSIYEFSFWGKWDFEAGRDGFRVEYSTDRGQSWRVLGSEDDEDWYNTVNQGFNTCAFPNNAAFFSKRVGFWTQFKLDITSLAGNSDVAFRFVCRSNAFGASPGMAIDDVVVSRFEGELATKLIDWEGAFTESTEITLTWRTLPEYFCKRFVLESSSNGKDFEEVATINATGGTTQTPQTYEHAVFAPLNLYFFRLKVINENTGFAYYYEFDAPTISVRRKFEGTEVYKVFPSPFTSYIDVTFTDVVNDTVVYQLYDVQGRQVFLGKETLAGATALRINVPYLAPGIYYLQVKIGEGALKATKLLKI